ncbi:MAG: exosome complex protein Rrp42 [Candidatus Aenigmatarchaeota archaeon]
MMKIAKEYIIDLAEKGMRIDKRKADEYRKIELETDVINTAEGSARVTLGNTVVIVGIKLIVGEPFADKPNEGVLMVGAELAPLADPEFEPGPPGIRSIELARVVDRTVRESKMLDLKGLCIKEGESVWMVNVDIHVMNFDGNLIDASNIAAVAALITAKMPKYEEGKINVDEKTGPLPITTIPMSVTVVKINGKIFVDPSKEEEEVANARLSVGMKENGNICSLQKGGDDGLTIEELHQILDLAGEKNKELRAVFR